MLTRKTAVVIGAGVGGITTALYLARNGFEVRVYEKNATPGGRCGQIIREGHRFDLGATIFLMPEIYRKVFASFGLTLEGCFPYTPLTKLYAIHFGDGTSLDFTTDPAHMEDQLERIERGSFSKSREVIQKGYHFFELAMDMLLGKNFYRLSDFATLKNAVLLLKLKTYMRHIVFIRRYFKNPNLQKAFTFQNIYVGQDPLKAPALFAMLASAELTEGSLYPAGGMYRITETLVALAEEAGVHFHYNRPVTRIITGKNRVAGVLLEDDLQVPADLVVANADLPYVYKELLPDKAMSAKLEKLKYSCSAIVMHWGLDKVYPQLSHHNVFLSESYEANLGEIFKNQSLSQNPSFYVHAPAQTDPSVAPGSSESLTVVIPSGFFDSRHNHDWNDLKNTARTSVIARLKKLGLTDIEEHIKFEICYLPQTWQGIFNVSRGATFGSVAHSIFQMGYFRPHNRHKLYKNLYFAGGSTHPGNGVPLVLLSAKLTSERILKEMGHE